MTETKEQIKLPTELSFPKEERDRFRNQYGSNHLATQAISTLVDAENAIRALVERNAFMRKSITEVVANSGRKEITKENLADMLNSVLQKLEGGNGESKGTED